MDPAEIPGLVGALLAGADVVKGSRAAAGGGSTDLSAAAPARQLGSDLLREPALPAELARAVLRLRGLLDRRPAGTGGARDRRAGRRPVRGSAYGHGFEIEAVLFCRSARAGLRVAEVFSFEHDRRNGSSNLSTWRDGWRVLTAVLRELRFRAAAEIARDGRRYPMVPVLHHVPAPRRVTAA